MRFVYQMEESRTLEYISEQLGEIRHLLLIIARDTITKDLDDIITTNEKRKVWSYCDGLNSTAEISQKAGVSMRYVQAIVKELQNSNLISIEKRGTPKRVFDFVPNTWGLKNA